MTSGRELAFATAVSGLVAGASLAMTSESLAPADLQAVASARWSESFSAGPWSWAPPAAAGAFGVALALTAVERALRRRGSSAAAARPLKEARRSETLTEVRGRLARSLGRAEPDVVAAWDDLLRGAMRLAASDVHVSPTPTGVLVTYRVDGELHEVAALPTAALAPLVSRLKVMTSLDTTVRNTPQDGRLQVTIDGEPLEARVSTLPTEAGERLVLRILRGGRTVPDVGALGLGEAVEQTLLGLLARPQGILFVTGPVGSGKTTTLYASLHHIARTRARTTSLVTLEDPIELELPFATQTQINAKFGTSFASGLRSVLRQDPNVLMVGEIRDPETAEIALQAGLTGHLILTTVHGQSAAGAFARVIEMGIEPFLLVSASIGCLSQRLVRRLCPACKKQAPVDPLVAERFAKAGSPVPDGVAFFGPVGCERCAGEGYAGRLPIVELLELSDPVRKAINDRLPAHEVTALAVKNGMVPLLADGLRRARSGETSLAEVARVAG